jgi:hypothetical protein
MKVRDILLEATAPLVSPEFVARAVRQHTGKLLPYEDIQHEIDRRIKAGEVTLPQGQYSDEAAMQILDQFLVKAFSSGTPEQFFSSPTKLIHIVDQILYNYENDAWPSKIFWNWYRKHQREYKSTYFRLAGKPSTDSAYIYDEIHGPNGIDWRHPDAVDPETGHLYPEYLDDFAKRAAKKLSK